MLTPAELKALRRIVARAEHAQPGAPLEPEPADIDAGDVVQILPTTDAAFGGMLALITRAEPYELRGFLLRPHRGGCREAWTRFHRGDVRRIGRALWPADATTFAGRCADQAAPHCARAKAL